MPVQNNQGNSHTMRTLKVSYSCYVKNKNRPSAHYYARVREHGKVKDIDLNTKERSIAEAWVRLRRSELERFNEYLLCGEEPPEELANKIIRASTPTIAQKGTSKAVLTLTKAIDEFELDCRRRGLRERTVMAYVRNLRQIVPTDASFADFTRDNVLKWLAAYDHLKSATRKFYSVSLRELAKFLVSRYDLDPRILTNWVMTKVDKVEKGYWRMNEIYQIIEAVECRDKVMQEQIKVYFWMMATAGSRQGETALIRWGDIKDGCVTFRAENTKNNKTRVVPLDMRVLDMLERMPHEGDLVFSAIPNSQSGRFSILSKAIKKSNMPKGGLHTFRHSASMYLYAHCQDLKAVSQLLGHSPETAMKYYQASRQADELRAMVDRAYAEENMIPSTMDELIKAGLW